MAAAPPIRVRAESEADATCLYESLQNLRGKVVRCAAAVVEVGLLGDRDRAIVDVLDVVRGCIDEHGLGYAAVELDGRTYALRGLAALA